MSENKISAWMRVANRQTEIFIKEISGPIHEYMPEDVAMKVIGAIWRCEDLQSYKTHTSEEQMEKDYLYESEYLDKCLTIVTDEQIAAGPQPNKELCTQTECPQFGPDCWATHSLEPGGMSKSLFLSLQKQYRDEVQKDWSDIRRWMYAQKLPTPTLASKELEKQFYAEKEQEYRDQGLYP
jgi:hypothetical protein